MTIGKVVSLDERDTWWYSKDVSVFSPHTDSLFHLEIKVYIHHNKSVRGKNLYSNIVLEEEVQQVRKKHA